MGTRAGPNPRRSPRTSQRLPLHLAVKFEGQDVVSLVNTVNYSKHGMRVQTNLPLRPGQAVYALPAKAKLPSGYCRVVWANEAEAGLELVH